MHPSAELRDSSASATTRQPSPLAASRGRSPAAARRPTRRGGPKPARRRPETSFASLPFPRAFWAALLLFALTLFTFGGTLHHQWVYWDDNGALVENPDFNPPTPAGPAKFWADPMHGYRGFYVPVTYTIWWVAAHIDRVPAGSHAAGGATMPNPVVFHALNLAFHAAAGVLASALLRKLTRADLPALFGAALFALHPLQADPVCWASSMYTPLSGLLALAALLLYLRYSDIVRERRGTPGGADAGQLRPHLSVSFLLATLCYALALLTKPTIILLPAVAAAVEVGLRGRRWRDCWPLMTWLALGAADALITRHTQLASEVYVPPLWLRPLVAADSLAFYLRKLALPFGLALDYGRSPKWIVTHGAVAISWLLPAAVAFACWKWRKKAPWLWVGAALFLAGALPTIGLTPYDYQFYSTVADRYLYFSMLGPALVLAFVVRKMTAAEPGGAVEGAAEGTGKDVLLAVAQTGNATEKPAQHPAIPASAVCEAASGKTGDHAPPPALSLFRPGLLALECALLLLAALSRTQTGYWQDSRTLFDHTLAVNADSLIAHRQLAFVMLIGEDPAEAESAITHYRASLRLYPEDAGALSNLGLLLSRRHRPAEAADAFRQALALRPKEAPIHYNLGNALAAAGMPEEALTAYAQALRLSPAFFEADLRRAAEMAAAGDTAGARLHYRAALQARPNWPAAVAALEGLKTAPGPQNASVNPRE